MTEKITNRITIDSTVQFTTLGRWGAVLFILAPIVAAFLVTTLPDALADAARYPMLHGSTVQGIYLAIMACGVAATAGLPMMLVGRQYKHDVMVQKPER